VRAMSVAHQFLSKPLQSTTLRSVVVRAIKMQKLLNRPEVLSLMGKIGNLPACLALTTS